MFALGFGNQSLFSFASLFIHISIRFFLLGIADKLKGDPLSRSVDTTTRPSFN